METLNRERVKRIIIWNNPLLDYRYYADIELETGIAQYKTNAFDPPDCSSCFRMYKQYTYECMFLLPKERLNRFIISLDALSEWEPYYGTGRIIDGYYWSVRMFGDTERIYKGENGTPPNFDLFIEEVELLLQKEFRRSLENI